MRFRFQYSLRTVFIVVTLLAIPCGYVGYNYQIVAHRTTMRENFKEEAGAHFVTLICGEIDPPRALLVRRCFGDELVRKIYVPANTPSSEVEEIKDAFPEALLVLKNFRPK